MKGTDLAVICLWEYVKPKSSGDRVWQLVDCYAVDDSGYPITPSKHAINDRNSYLEFVCRRYWMVRKGNSFLTVFNPPKGQDNTDCCWEPIPGRMAVCFSIRSGIRILDFVQPEEVDWINATYRSFLIENPDKCFNLLRDGWFVKMTSTEHAWNLLMELERKNNAISS